MSDPASHTPGIPPDAVSRFTAAEARLYPLAMVDPDAYERAVSLVGMLMTPLRATCPDIDAVLQYRDTLLLLLTETTDQVTETTDQVTEATDEARTSRPSLVAFSPEALVGFSPETLVDAACALRCHELQARP